MIYDAYLTLVVNLYCRAPRNASRVSHHAVVFGGTRRKRFRAKSNMLRSTASDGTEGVQGKRPRRRSCNGAGEQVHVLISKISRPVENVNSIGQLDVSQTYTGNRHQLSLGLFFAYSCIDLHFLASRYREVTLNNVISRDTVEGVMG